MGQHFYWYGKVPYGHISPFSRGHSKLIRVNVSKCAVFNIWGQRQSNDYEIFNKVIFFSCYGDDDN